MPKPPTKLHVRDQQAAVLLDPVRLELNRMTARLDHYLDKAKIDDDGVEALQRARSAVADTAAEIAAIATEAKLR